MTALKWDRDKVKIEIELTPREIEYLSTTCLARVLNSAKHALPDNYDYLDDVEDAMLYEQLRMRICNAVFILREQEHKQREAQKQAQFIEENPEAF